MDIHQPCQCPPPDGGARIFRAGGRGNGGFPRLSPLGTARAGQAAQGQTPFGRVEMEKFESFAFAIGFIGVGLLTLVAQVTIV
jgi:hypothetical protein